MPYLDTSFIAPLFIAEDTSKAVEAYLLTLPAETLTTGAWTKVEFASLVSRRQRMGELTAEQAQEVRAEFARVMAESITLLTPTAADYELAAELLANFKSGLRAGDALHLATAHNQGELELLSLDKTLVKVANSLGIKASVGIRGAGKA